MLLQVLIGVIGLSVFWVGQLDRVGALTQSTIAVSTEYWLSSLALLQHHLRCAHMLVAATLLTRKSLVQGLLLFPAMVIVPMLEVMWMLFILVSGGIYFRDFQTFSKLQLAMFGVGVFILLLGMACLIPWDAGAGTRQHEITAVFFIHL